MGSDKFSEKNENETPKLTRASESPYVRPRSPLAELAAKRIAAIQELNANPADAPLTPLQNGVAAPIATEAALQMDEAKARLVQAYNRKKAIQAAQRQAKRGCRACGKHRRS